MYSYHPKNKPPFVFRQPPPPIRPNKGGSPKHGMMTTQLNTLRSTENCSNVAARTRPFYFRSCKRRKIFLTTSIESLPDELIFEILVRVPAKDIYNNNTRLVCRKWYKIIHTHGFVHAHLNQSKCGILTHGEGLYLSFLASGEGLTTEMSKLNYTFTNLVLSSCNGLVLELLHHDSFDICITNPITQQNFALPPFFVTAIQYGYALAYAATSMEYKVVRAFFSYHKPEAQTNELQDEHVTILTVGVDKDWTRRVSTRHLSPTAKGLFFSQQYPFTTEGFVHWADEKDSRSKCVLTLNVETEVITEFALPRSLHPHDDCENHEKINYYYLPTENYLSLLIERSKFSWESWEMKPETGEWTKLPNIDLEAQFASDLNCILTPWGAWLKRKDCILTPGGWLKFREVLVFRLSCKNMPLERTKDFISCNVCTREFHKFELSGGTRRFVPHRNSLVWLGKS